MLLLLKSLLFMWLLIFVTPAMGQKFWRPEEMPNPRFDPLACGAPVQTGFNSTTITNQTTWLCDPEHVVTAFQFESLNEQLATIHREVQMNCSGSQRGYEVAIAVIRRVDPQGQDMDVAIDEFTDHLRRLVWRTGVESCDNGIVILVSTKDGYICFSIGANARRKVSNRRVSSILDVVGHILANRTVAKGLSVAVDTISVYLRGSDAPADSSCTDDCTPSRPYITYICCGIGGVVLVLLVGGWIRRRYVKRRNEKRRLFNLEKTQFDPIPSVSTCHADPSVPFGEEIRVSIAPPPIFSPEVIPARAPAGTPVNNSLETPSLAVQDGVVVTSPSLMTPPAPKP